MQTGFPQPPYGASRSFNPRKRFSISFQLNSASATESVQFGSLIKAAVSAPSSNYPRQMQLGFKLLW